jgi:hypothetical protein
MRDLWLLDVRPVVTAFAIYAANLTPTVVIHALRKGSVRKQENECYGKKQFFRFGFN